MAWNSGVTRAVNYLVTNTNWNEGMGAGGNFDLLSDGTRVVMPVYESSMEIGNAPSNKKLLTADASQTGGLQWDGDVEEPLTFFYLNM